MKNKSSIDRKSDNPKAKTSLNIRSSLFRRTLIISTAVILVLLTSCAVIIKTVVKPPVITQSIEENDLNYNEIAFLPPDGHNEDMFIGNGLHAPEGFTATDRKEQLYTFLIVGLDDGVSTDTIMVASYDGVNKEANIISIPRDSMVNVKRNVKKINGAYAAGALHDGGKQGGINQLRREVKTIIGFIPDFYICVDLDAFVKIVDAVGGIEVNVPLNMKYDDPAQNLHIDIKKGKQLLNGKNALKFARYRNGNNSRAIISDYQRIENQQAVIKAMLDKLMKPASILKIPEFINIFNENVYSDIKPENMIWLADQLNKIKATEMLSTYTLPTKGTSGPPMYYEYLDEDAIVELVNKTINPYKKDIKARNLDIITDN